MHGSEGRLQGELDVPSFVCKVAPRARETLKTQLQKPDSVSSPQEVQSFSKTTDVHKLASELEDKLPDE